MLTTTHGSRKRAEILERAVDLSTTEGLESLSFSQLAAEVGLTKAGVASHFESKEQLLLAVVGAAAEAYQGPFAEAQAGSEPGLPRLAALAGAWLQHLDTLDYRGGCFFAAAGQAYAGRPGPIRDAIAKQVHFLIRQLEEQARLAFRLGELKSGVDPELLAFQVHGLAQEANMRRELLQDKGAFDAARKALTELLERSASNGAPDLMIPASSDPMTSTRAGRPRPRSKKQRRPKETS